MSDTNNAYLQSFIAGAKGGEFAMRGYVTKLKKLAKEVKFDDPESSLLEHLGKVQNPNTRSNKAFALIRLRRHLKMPIFELEVMREDLKKEIMAHRKKKATADLEKLISYEGLLTKLDALSGKDYIMNYMWVKHGLRNKDINVAVKRQKPKEITENVIVFNPNSKSPKATYHITDYKTASTYGDKSIVITDKRFFEELSKLGLKNNQYLFSKQDGTKATVNYMNVLASRRSNNQYGEGRIAKILIKHLLDTKQYGKIELISKQRGTALSTIYDPYNLYAGNQAVPVYDNL